jgi:hypothetical protein
VGFAEPLGNCLHVPSPAGDVEGLEAQSMLFRVSQAIYRAQSAARFRVPRTAPREPGAQGPFRQEGLSESFHGFALAPGAVRSCAAGSADGGDEVLYSRPAIDGRLCLRLLPRLLEDLDRTDHREGRHEQRQRGGTDRPPATARSLCCARNLCQALPGRQAFRGTRTPRRLRTRLLVSCLGIRNREFRESAPGRFRSPIAPSSPFQALAPSGSTHYERSRLRA